MKKTIESTGDAINEVEILFGGGAPQIPSQEVFDQAAARNPTWYKVITKAFEQITSSPEGKEMYGDPKGKGGTLEQSWMVFTLFGIFPYCLLASHQPRVPTNRIKRVIKLTPQQLVGMLKELFQTNERTAVTTQCYDGQTGHCITLHGYDATRDRFIYHDSWPLDSLLCKANNAKEVDAQREVGERKRWSVTTDELEVVIFAAMVFPQAWARMQGIEFERYYSNWQQEEFYKFFHLSEQQKEEDSKGGYCYWLETGGFKGSNFMIVVTDSKGKITEAKLVVNRVWMNQPQNIPFALDICKSFIASLFPPPDEAEYQPLVEMIWGLNMPDFAQKIKEAGENASQNHRFVFCIIGTVEEANILSDFGQLVAKNNWDKNKPSLEITWKLN